jgi:iron complex transport system substrate-binding protein
MTRTFAANTVALVLALGLTVAAAWDPKIYGRNAGPVVPAGLPAAPAWRRASIPGGGEGLADATGYVVPLRPYQRIISTSTLTDRLLVELCEPTRVLAFSEAGARTSQWAYQYAGKAVVDSVGPIEALLALKPDLILMNSFGAFGRIAKLRAAGIEVFDLGQLRGVATLLPMAELLAELLGHPERGRRFTVGFRHRIDNVAAKLGARIRRRAMYIASIGSGLYGGAAGTSYHDVITYAGLTDAAAGRFSEWPRYSSEQILELAPDLIVTKEGMGRSVCAYPGMNFLPACAGEKGIIELPAALVDDPGPAILDAAEELFRRVY